MGIKAQVIFSVMQSAIINPLLYMYFGGIGLWELVIAIIFFVLITYHCWFVTISMITIFIVTTTTMMNANKCISTLP